MRIFLRDVLLSYFGHDFGIGISVSSHSAFFKTIVESNVNPLVKLLLSHINSYYKNESDVFDLAGSISVSLEQSGFRYNEKDLLRSIYRSFDSVIKPTSSVDLWDLSGDVKLVKVTPRFEGRVLKYSIILVVLIFILSISETHAVKTDKSLFRNLVIPDAKTLTPLPVATDVETPWWSKIEAEKAFTVEGFPDTGTESFFEKYTRTIRRQHEMRTKQFHLSDNVAIRVNRESKIMKIRPHIHEDVVKWSEYMINIIDPAYLWNSNEKLILNLSPRIEKGFETAGGYFNPNSGDVWIRDDPKTMDPLLIIHSVIHEIAHKVHLDQPDIAVQCRNKPSILCKHRTVIHQSSDITSDHISSKYEEAQRVLYLGIPSENMTADEAKLYIKLHLDTRIRLAYDSSVRKRIYKGFAGYDYAMSDYREYWAEASASFIVGNYSRFPSREWVKQNDPGLYDILEEVYPGSDLTSTLETSRVNMISELFNENVI